MQWKARSHAAYHGYSHVSGIEMMSALFRCDHWLLRPARRCALRSRLRLIRRVGSAVDDQLVKGVFWMTRRCRAVQPRVVRLVVAENQTRIAIAVQVAPTELAVVEDEDAVLRADRGSSRSV